MQTSPRISLPTSEPIRKALNAAGFVLLAKPNMHSPGETWWTPDDPLTALVINEDGEPMVRGRLERFTPVTAALGISPEAQALSRLGSAVVAMDMILFPNDLHGDEDRLRMRQQLVTCLADEMERRGWARYSAENVEFIEEAVKRAHALTATQPGMRLVPESLLSALIGTAEEYVEEQARMGNDLPETAKAIAEATRIIGGV